MRRQQQNNSTCLHEPRSKYTAHIPYVIMGVHFRQSPTMRRDVIGYTTTCGKLSAKDTHTQKPAAVCTNEVDKKHIIQPKNNARNRIAHSSIAQPALYGICDVCSASAAPLHRETDAENLGLYSRCNAIARIRTPARIRTVMVMAKMLNEY